MPIATKILLDVGQARKIHLRALRYGAQMETATGLKVNDLELRATADRWHLAYDLRRRGNRLMLLPRPLYRDAISRFYYSMYHSMRAVAYLYHGGDDHEKHSELPGHVPTDFQNADVWANNLKNAREIRNRADYEPYPKSDTSWRVEAQQLQQHADELLNLARTYLAASGCAL